MTREVPLTLRKIAGNFFVLLVLSLIAFVYARIMNLYSDGIDGILHADYRIFAYLVYIHISLAMLLWCLVKTMITDPGMVPPLWGFYMGDSEQKRRRYCLMCHVFKPERCHHCSVCNRCVLNMDHHCRKIYSAWINNCIGFFNRKFFLLFLTYVIITIWGVTAGFFPPAYSDFLRILQSQKIQSFKETENIFTFLLILGLTGVLSLFYKFHVGMIMANLTTIESMDKKNCNTYKIYNKGLWLNFVQIFGTNPWLWPFPVFLKSGMPVGDGVIWNRETGLSFEEEIQATEEYAKSMQRNKVFSSSLENINASRDLISPKKDDNSKRDTDLTVNSFRGNFQSTRDSIP